LAGLFRCSCLALDPPHHANIAEAVADRAETFAKIGRRLALLHQHRQRNFLPQRLRRVGVAAGAKQITRYQA
jgi:hypothetical protein